MSDEQDTMISPGLEALLEKVDSRFTLVSLAAKRSRQLIAYDLGLGEGGGSEVPPQVTSTARKSLSTAFEEIEADKIPSLMIYNKGDLLDDFSPCIDRDAEDLPVAVWVSALAGQGMNLVLQAIIERLPSKIVHQHLQLQQIL